MPTARSVRRPDLERRGPWGAVACLALAAAAAPLLAQQPTFRGGVDLVAVDVQAVDDDGNPVTGLGPDRFDVSIGGRRRRVVSADLIAVAPAGGDVSAERVSSPSGASPEPGRQVILAIDRSSFDGGALRPAMEAARAFVDTLRSDDRIGLYAYPSGPQLPPSIDRAALRIALGSLVGARLGFNGVFHLKPSEVVDITAQGPVNNPASLAGRVRVARDSTTTGMETDPLRSVQARECPDDPECASRIMSEASAEALHLEAQASVSLGGLDTLLQALVRWPGRKTVVLVSAGVLVSDRPGGRPDVGTMAIAMGHAAAAADAVVYTIHMDSSFSGTYAANQRRIAAVERDRDRRLFGEWLEQFSAASGGARLHVPVGAGEFAFDRIRRETGAYYLLGVEPQRDDRDGRPHELGVKIHQRGVTVRSRRWVVLPKA
jgi:VWFA-related protein